jgi:hypothetical protein
MQLPNLVPGFVHSYDGASRVCRVRFPGTDGSSVFPVAEFCYPVGFNSEQTEIKVVAGDRVWLAFRNGDPRFPIVMGYRPKETDNATEVLRLQQQHVEITADAAMKLKALANSLEIEAGGVVRIKGTSIEFEGPVKCNNTLTAQGLIKGSEVQAGNITLTGHHHGFAGSGTVLAPTP